MTTTNQPSYADLVHEALRWARRPLTFPELFDEVDRQRHVATRDPKATVRNALSQDVQLVSLGDGYYGYLPHLIQGSLLRVPLLEKSPANHPLVFTEEARDALWPSFFAIQKRQRRGPVKLRLVDGPEIQLPLEFLGHKVWGSSMPEGLRHYLLRQRAAAGDGLIIRVVDAEEGHFEGWFDSRRKQDKNAVVRRNQELADAAYSVLRRARPGVLIWDLTISLLARGFYRSDVAPAPLEEVLAGDNRFVDAGWDVWITAESVTPEIEAGIYERKLREGLWQIQEETEQSALPSSVTGARSAMERVLADVSAALADRSFESPEEINAALQDTLAAGGLPRRRALTPLQKAQDLIYDAWDAPTLAERARLARRALDLSPDCADAYVVLAEATARTAQEAAAFYAKGVAAGERALGSDVFAQDGGHFWGILETRPYMRARLGLATALWTFGKRGEAIDHLWEMLRLNPGDNQGVRDPLLTWLLEAGDDAQAERLLDLYPDDIAAFWTYGRVLHAFRSEGDSPRACQLLGEAEKGNPHVPAYLLGQRTLPALLPELVGYGDESEAQFCASEQNTAWRKTRGALEWLTGRSATAKTAGYPGTGRNEPCPCASGLKYKRCHGR